jgi:TonB-linked SusC/RagA family outer membrane protein
MVIINVYKRIDMKRYILLVIAFALGIGGYAQEKSENISGIVVDKFGNPVSGALIELRNSPDAKTYTDQQGKFSILADKDAQLFVDAPDQSEKTITLTGSKDVRIVMDYASRPVNIGFGIRQNVEESTMSVASASNDEFNNRSAKNIGNSLFGHVLGLTTLQGTGEYSAYEPTFFVRGLQTLAGNNPLILVDGIERNISYITPEEVENVIVLKDAPAVALYGYKGANGVVNIITKRGKYKSNEIHFSYDHAFNWEERRPKFVDAYTYASAMNEALTNDGNAVKYSPLELDAFKTGKYPFLYPNVNWIDEAFKNLGGSNIYDLSFRGGGEHMRYYSLMNLQDNNGFIAHPNMNSGYSTQNKYSKANLRFNLDIDLTNTTSVQVNLDGVLLETLRPGLSSDGLWDKIYTVPAAAFPVKTESGLWGGNATWDGYSNPVALTEGRAYSKAHTRALFGDMTLKQNLSSLTQGLSVWTRLAYDNIAAYWENHTKSYRYGSDAVSEWTNGEPSAITHYTGGNDSSLGTDSKLDWQNKNFNFGFGTNYDRTFGNHAISSVLMWNYEYRNSNGQNNTWYRTSASWYNHYGYKGRYFADLSLTMAGSNKLAPGHRWAFSPAVSAAWVISKEKFMRNMSFVDLLKLRASWGIINVDNIPAEGYWEQTYGGGNGYNLGGNYDWDGGWTRGRLASTDVTHERSTKYNVGVDATLFKGLDITMDGYYQRRSDIWVSASGRNSSVLGSESPYVNGGVVDSYGFEMGLNYTKMIGRDFIFNGGANYTLSKDKIKNELEEPHAYSYLDQTNHPVGQIFGLQAIGFFKDQADIDHSPVQQFSDVKPGDIKYKDQNRDGVINEEDVVKMGYNTTCPEIYFSFHLGAEYKGIGLDADLQGVGNYTAILNTKSLYWPLINNTNISKYYYDNRWTPEHTNAKFPRLTAESNANNFRTNSIWLEDRSFLKLRNLEVYYKFPKSILTSTKFISTAKLYVRGVDLLCLDHIKKADPEQYGADYPLNRSLVVGLALGF